MFTGIFLNQAVIGSAPREQSRHVQKLEMANLLPTGINFIAH